MRISTILIAALVAAYACTQPQELSDLVILKGATLYDGNGNRISNSIIIINGDQIESVGDESVAIPDGAQVVELDGKFITPGLIDAHVHFFQTAFFDSRPDALDLRDSLPHTEAMAYQRDHPERYYEAYLRSGVTGVYDVGGYDWSVGLQESAENDPNAPYVSAAGRLITPASEERISIFNTPDDTVMVHLGYAEIGRRMVAHNSAIGSTGIKVWGMSSSDTAFTKNIATVADEVRNQGNKLIVHATDLKGAKDALRLGAKVLVHSVENQMVDDEFIQMALQNKTVLTPTLVVFYGYYNTYKAVLGEGFSFEDPNNVIDNKTKALLQRAAEFSGLVDTARLRSRLGGIERGLARRDSVMALNLKKLFESGVLLAAGTDAGNPGTLHGTSIFDELERMQEFGIPAEALIGIVTRNGAIAMDRLEDFGTLETGKKANLIILENDPAQDISNMRSITHFMKGGSLRSVKEKF